MKKSMTLLLASALLCSTAPALAKNDNSQAGGLPALAAEVAELRALVEALQDQAGGEVSYAGTYAVSYFESGNFGCGFTNDPATVIGTPGFLAYLQAQGISSTVSRTAYFTADSDGNVITFPSFALTVQEVRLSGTAEFETRFEDSFAATIAPDGSLLLDAGPGAVFSGQMSDDGSSFVAHAHGQFVEDDCDDSFAVIAVGVRI